MACRRNGYWAIPPSTPTTSAPTSGPSTPRPSSPRILRGPRNCRSTNTSTRKGIWSNAASTSSSTSGAWQPVTRRLRGTSSPSSPSRLSPCGSDDCQQDLGRELINCRRSDFRLALTRLFTAWRAGGRAGSLEARPRRVPVIIAGQMGCVGERLRAFRQLPDAMEDRQQIDVGEGELLVDEIAGLGDRLVENPDLFAHRRQDGIDRLSIRRSIGGPRRYMRR